MVAITAQLLKSLQVGDTNLGWLDTPDLPETLLDPALIRAVHCDVTPSNSARDS